MARRRVPVAVLVVAALVAGLGVLLFQSSRSAVLARDREERLAEAAGGDVVRAAAPRAAIVVDGVRIEVSEARVVVDIAVTLSAVRTVVVGAQVSGRVIEVATEDNRKIAAGDLLVRLDPALPEAEVARARAGVVRAESIYALATHAHGRQRNLSGQGVASKADFDRTESEEASNAARVAEAKAALIEAETRLDKMRITALFGGVVSELDVEPGAYLRVGDPVARVTDFREIEIEAGVDDRQILALTIDTPVRLVVDAYPGEFFAARIHSLARTPDPMTKKYVVPVRVENADERLLPGMLGKVRFTLGKNDRVLRIPRRAVYREFEVEYLYVLADAKPISGSPAELEAEVERRRVHVKPVAFRPDLVDIEGGLVSGEMIAISGIRDLHQGLRVRVRESAGWGLP